VPLELKVLKVLQVHRGLKDLQYKDQLALKVLQVHKDLKDHKVQLVLKALLQL
jgi:hypothetical protein